MNLYSSKTLTDNHTHRRTHARDKHNKTAEKKEKRIIDQCSDEFIHKSFASLIQKRRLWMMYSKTLRASLHRLDISRGIQIWKVKWLLFLLRPNHLRTVRLQATRRAVQYAQSLMAESAAPSSSSRLQPSMIFGSTN